MSISKYPLFLFCVFVSAHCFSQVVGKVSDSTGKPLPYVNIYLKNVAVGTTTNKNGDYELTLDELGEHTLVFQYLGYKTEQKEIEIQAFPFTLNVSLTEESTSLAPVILSNGENPAIRIIENAIEHRQENQAKLQKFTADFYSRGLWRVQNVPEKFMGAEIGDLGGGLDSTRSGVVYLSETISKIAYQAPDNFKEKVIASKVSGDDNGFSFNSAREFNISFYNNTLEINAEIVSPIADYAFNYYNYKLEGTFYDEPGNLINKIQVIPKRPDDAVFSGHIYIVENSWEIYGVDLSTTGEAVQVPIIEKLGFQQNFKYSKTENRWVLRSQNITFSWAIFGVSGSGRFLAVYSNYDFSPDFEKNTFTNEILSFAKNANEKDSLFWKEIRPVPLTEEERNDYIRKDSIQLVRESKTYLDSIDHVRNKIDFSALFFGYHWQNSHKNLDFNISGPAFGIHFNTVQGWNLNLETSFQKSNESRTEYWRIFANTSYGFSDERFRISGGFRQKFNNFSKPLLQISGGIETRSINDTDPIPLLVNDVANILFERNYLKLYDRLFAEAAYSVEVFNGFRAYSSLSFEKRKPLFNTTDHVFVENKGVEYTSNNPLQPQNFGSMPFVEHNIAKLELGVRINFGQKYYRYPDGKYIADENNWPLVFLGYEKGFASTVENYDYNELKFMLIGDFSLQNKGDLEYSLKTGTFFNAENMAFLDYKHFNGNQTRVGTTPNYIGKFNLLPYYDLSTDQEYAEAHLEHDFQGWVLGKIPFVSKLNLNLIAGAKSIFSGGRKPYSEVSLGIDNIGIGKFRFLRLDYVRSFYGDQQEGALIFGIKFFGLLER